MKSSLSSSLLKGSLGLGLWLLPTPLAQLLSSSNSSQFLVSAGPRAASVVFLLSSGDFFPSWEDLVPPQIPGPSSHENLSGTPAPRLEGRGTSGSRGPWSRGVQGSPSSHHSFSSAVLVGPPRDPLHPQPKRASSRDPRLATFRLCAVARPLLRFHGEGGMAGYGRI